MASLEELLAENEADHPPAPPARPGPTIAPAAAAAPREPAPTEDDFSLSGVAHTAAEVVKPWGEYSPTRYVYERLTGQREAAEPERVAQAAGEGVQRGVAMGFDAPYAYLQAAGQWLGGDDRGYGELVQAAEAERAEHRQAYPLASSLGEGAGAVAGGLATGGYGSAALAERAPAAIRGVAEALIDAGTQTAVNKVQGKQFDAAGVGLAAAPAGISRLFPGLRAAAKGKAAAKRALEEGEERLAGEALEPLVRQHAEADQLWRAEREAARPIARERVSGSLAGLSRKERLQRELEVLSNRNGKLFGKKTKLEGAGESVPRDLLDETDLNNSRYKDAEHELRELTFSEHLGSDKLSALERARLELQREEARAAYMKEALWDGKVTDEELSAQEGALAAAGERLFEMSKESDAMRKALGAEPDAINAALTATGSSYRVPGGQ